ncbi:response regulator transcription factor [Rhodoferax antarcticus]|uniref:response regulator transcription factor n=1 Tax=Rhodoferax antarcticus TaxID=81479 RepID=UPI002223F698|nr:response regulator [Rhodoferax antarcticus]MCW2311596.1 CheY-like chemotaxis protein [Rhodoferax antarcticus]
MSRTLLIVDDSKVSRMMIRAKMAQLQPDWIIQEAANGEVAVAMVRASAPDFITMDVNMPGINGFEAVEQIRAFNTTARIAMLTANIQEASRERAAELKVTFVKKPATEPAIREAIYHFLAAS